MTDPTTPDSFDKRQDFKQRFATLLRDVQQNGARDPEAMGLLGSLASELAANLKAKSWTGAKRNMSSQSYQTLLTLFETQGNEHHGAGRAKHAYAIQILAVSLIAHTQSDDPQMVAGEDLLDVIIDRAVMLHQKQALRAS